MLIDTHCHLDAGEFAGDREQVLQRARGNGVAAIVVPSVGPGNFDAVRRLANQEPDVAYALGIHPMYLDGVDDSAIDALSDALTAARDDPRLVAVGEIGLDFFVPGFDAPRQERFYEAQLRLAAHFNLPVILHVRKSQDRLLKYLRKIPVSGGIAHAFNGSFQQANGFLDLGFALGFGGAQTFERALQIRRLIRELPATAHVLETDAPDIAPQWLARGRNEPGEMSRIAQVFAGLRDEPVDAACEVTGRNAFRVLPRLADAFGSI